MMLNGIFCFCLVIVLLQLGISVPNEEGCSVAESSTLSTETDNDSVTKPINNFENEHLSPRKRKSPQFQDTVNYVNKIKVRFIDNKNVYKQFLDILKNHKNDKKELLWQIGQLFHGHGDLIDEFIDYLSAMDGNDQIRQKIDD
ncbi:hypothetical protein niasHT_029815 [Heterodera trifolii]|uniref:Uncharacterized protein n=1 Tax=Heterodera trifolii TaxID=157864 RepID=A0ABD2K317_9BILA